MTFEVSFGDTVVELEERVTVVGVPTNDGSRVPPVVKYVFSFWHQDVCHSVEGSSRPHALSEAIKDCVRVVLGW